MKINKFNEGIKYKEYFTVKDLINHLQQFDSDLPVGTSGHFGEFIPFDESDFEESRSHLNPKGISINDYYWRNLVKHPYSPILKITAYDLGPDPD